jgi:hypothetical protein
VEKKISHRYLEFSIDVYGGAFPEKLDIYAVNLVSHLLEKDHFAYRHLAYRHWAYRHLAYRHLANRHLASRHMTTHLDFSVINIMH